MSIYEQLFSGLKIKEHGSTSIKIDGKTFRQAELIDRFEPSMGDEFVDYFRLSEPKKKHKLFMEALKVAEKTKMVQTKGIALPDGRRSVIELDCYEPVALVEHNNEQVLYDRVERKISTMSYNFLLRKIRDKDLKADFMSREVNGKLVFNPKRTESEWQEREWVTYNMYKAPMWRTVDLDGELPDNFKRFIEFLIPSQEARMYTLRWIREMIEGQNYTYLVLNGMKGIGKSALIKMLTYLVGPDYVGKPPRNWLDTHFNAWLENKRLIYSEECTLSEERHEQMKDLIEGDQSITKKGKDALKSAPIHASYILTNNKIKNCYAEWDDRRFSYIELTNEEFDGDLGALIDEIENDLESIAYKTQLGKWLLAQEYEEWDARMPYKGDKFDLIVKNSLPTWQRALVECAIEGKNKYDMRMIREKWENPQEMKWPKELTVQDFVNGFRPHGKKLGDYQDKTFYPRRADGRENEQGQRVEL